MSFRVKALGAIVEKSHDRVVKGTVPDGWKSVGVITGRGDKHRFFVLVPASDASMVAHHNFQITGNFEVLTHINNPRAARSAWAEFEAA